MCLTTLNGGREVLSKSISLENGYRIQGKGLTPSQSRSPVESVAQTPEMDTILLLEVIRIINTPEGSQEMLEMTVSFCSANPFFSMGSQTVTYLLLRAVGRSNRMMSGLRN